MVMMMLVVLVRVRVDPVGVRVSREGLRLS